MVSVFEKMGAAEKKEGGDRMPKFLRTHPHSNDRCGERRPGCEGALL